MPDEVIMEMSYSTSCSMVLTSYSESSAASQLVRPYYRETQLVPLVAVSNEILPLLPQRRKVPP